MQSRGSDRWGVIGESVFTGVGHLYRLGAITPCVTEVTAHGGLLYLTQFRSAEIMANMIDLAKISVEVGRVLLLIIDEALVRHLRAEIGLLDNRVPVIFPVR